METRANYVVIGAVTVLGILGMLGFFLWLAKVEIDRQYAYYDVLFESVSGLDRAAVVRFNGLPVGQVVSLGFDAIDPNRVRVRLELRGDTPVTTDTVATLESQGVTGVSYVSLSGGGADAPLLASVSRDEVPEIPAALSVVQTLVEGAPDIVAQTAEVLQQLLRAVGPENQAYVADILANLEGASGRLEEALADFSSISRSVADATGQIGGFTDRLDEIAATATTTLESADATFRATTEVISTAEGTLAAATGALGGIETAAVSFNETLVQDVPRLVDDAHAAIVAVEATVTGLGVGAQGLTVRLDDLIGLAADRLRQAETSLSGLESTLAQVDSALSAVETASVSFEDLIDGDGVALVGEARTVLAQASRTFDVLELIIAEDLPVIVADTRAALTDVRTTVGTVSDVVTRVGADVTGFSGRLEGVAGSAETMLVTATGTLQDASRTFARTEAALDTVERTFVAAESAFVGAARIIEEDAGPIAQDLRDSVARLSSAVVDVSADLPAITAEMRTTLAAVTAMVNQIDGIVRQSSGPIGAFTQTGLPEFVRFTNEARSLTSDLQRLIARIERDPARFFLGGQAPEFRR